MSPIPLAAISRLLVMTTVEHLDTSAHETDPAAFEACTGLLVAVAIEEGEA